MSKIEVNAIEPQCGTTLTVGASGDTITFPSGTTVVNNGTQTGFGRTGTVDWDTTAKTAGFTAVSGNGYFVNTTSGAITVTLPATPSAGDIVAISDYANTAITNNITVGRNGSNIEGAASDLTINNNGASVTFVYVDGTRGWKVVNTGDKDNTQSPTFVTATGGTITCCGDYKIHTFTSPGTFCVSVVSCCASNNEVSYIVVAGGGGGNGGGGGAGGFRENKSPLDIYTASPLNGSTPITVTATAFPITVGAGGAVNNPGNDSIFSTITSTAGGKGGGANTPPGVNGGPGGSGGGGGYICSPVNNPIGGGSAGTGNTPPVSPSQGNNGEDGGSGYFYVGGGGGGAGTIGNTGTVSPGPGTPSNGGPGGNGVATSITGSSVTRAGGGGGMRWGCVPGTPGQGGTGGGGNAKSAGTANTGGGGGGIESGDPSPGSAGAGGSGIVIIRYKFQ
jgi:hypothetical protein